MKCKVCKGTGHIAWADYFVPEENLIEIVVEHCRECGGSGNAAEQGAAPDAAIVRPSQLDEVKTIIVEDAAGSASPPRR